jgi:ubiquitin-like domain-containing CTD phosphatase 1
MAAACSSSSSPSTEEEITLKVKWSGKEYTVRVCADDTVGELKRRICESTNVLPIRQKLLYPKLASKLNDDSLLLSQLPINLNNSSIKFTMIGFAFFPFRSLFFYSSIELFIYLFMIVNYNSTTEEDLIVDPVESPEILDDFELPQEEAVDIKDMQVNKLKLSRRINHFKVLIHYYLNFIIFFLLCSFISIFVRLFQSFVYDYEVQTPYTETPSMRSVSAI